MVPIYKKRLLGVATVGVAWGLAAAISVLSLRVYAGPDEPLPSAPSAQPAIGPPSLDRSGRVQIGKASFYADKYLGHTMADGTPLRLYSNNAASLTLPLGTTAKVTNLKTGQSAVVTIRDRGPYAKGRIVDLSPVTAANIGINRKTGIAKVSVTPMEIPMADGTIRVASLR